MRARAGRIKGDEGKNISTLEGKQRQGPKQRRRCPPIILPNNTQLRSPPEHGVTEQLRPLPDLPAARTAVPKATPNTQR